MVVCTQLCDFNEIYYCHDSLDNNVYICTCEFLWNLHLHPPCHFMWQHSSCNFIEHIVPFYRNPAGSRRTAWKHKEKNSVFMPSNNICKSHFMPDLRFSQHFYWKFNFFGMWHCVRFVVSNISRQLHHRCHAVQETFSWTEWPKSV